jgi:hypothetical protein
MGMSSGIKRGRLGEKAAQVGEEPPKEGKVALLLYHKK